MGHEALETQRAAAGPGPGLRAGLAFALSCPEDSWVVAMYPWQVSDGGDICSLIATRSGLKAVSPEVLNIWPVRPRLRRVPRATSSSWP